MATSTIGELPEVDVINDGAMLEIEQDNIGQRVTRGALVGLTEARIASALGYTPQDASQPAIPGPSTIVDAGDISGSYNFDLDGVGNGLLQATLTGDATIAFDNVAAGAFWTIVLKQDATGDRTAGFAGVLWPLGFPALSRLPNAIGIASFLSSDGSTIYGFPATSAAIPFPGYAPARLENMPRLWASTATALVAGRVQFSALVPDRDFLASNILSMSRGTAASGGTLAKMALYLRDGNTYAMLAQTASDTALWTTNDIYPRPIEADGNGDPLSTVQLYAGVTYVIAYLFVGTTAPQMGGVVLGSNAASLLSPRLSAVSGTGQTDLSANYNLAGGFSNVMWGAVS